jgi:hypothetical protein
MPADHACERCHRDDVEGFVDIASTPMRRVVRSDPFPEVDVTEAVLVCEECAEDFGARAKPVPPTEFVADGDRTAG